MLDQAHKFLAENVSADRHARSEDPDDPATVQAMQIALHIPKPERPRRTPLLESAARAVVAVCLDDRAVTDDGWHEGLQHWYDHLIRKIARRGRNKPWEDVQKLPGVTMETDGVLARAFVPTAVADVPHEIKKLQIKGTDLPMDEESAAEPAPGLPLIAVNADLEMTTGKAAAQVGHGSMLLAAAQDLEWVRRWADKDFALQVREYPAQRLRELVADNPEAVVVRDAGYTEVAPDSATVVALPYQS
ncbi:aminoacyl-tRNA hydrolase [Corynebacterium yudongzhengii]|nr:peptidyl-tRNA hydrolase [Corynebacterium yudongzhengii]